METSNEKVKIVLYVPEKEKQQLWRIAESLGYKRHDFLIASLVVGAVILDALYKGEFTERSIGPLMFSKGRKMAAALMAIGTSVILRDLVRAIGGDIDLEKGLEQWREVDVH